MVTPSRTAPRRLGEAMRRKLEVTAALAWEALVDTHVDQAGQFVDRIREYWPVEESLPRYFREMDLDETMVAAIRTRVLSRVEEPPLPGDDAASNEGTAGGGGRAGVPGVSTAGGAGMSREEEPADDNAWGILRQPARMVRGVMERQRRNEHIDRIVQLCLARAEEAVICTHVENAISVVALLEEQMPLDRCVVQYLNAVGLHGGRAQTVFQRTMARLADVHL